MRSMGTKHAVSTAHTSVSLPTWCTSLCSSIQSEDSLAYIPRKLLSPAVLAKDKDKDSVLLNRDQAASRPLRSGIVGKHMADLLRLMTILWKRHELKGCAARSAFKQPQT